VNKLAKSLSILSILLTIPTIAFVVHANPDHVRGQIADARMERGEKLQLTPEQKTKMEQLRKSVNTQIEQVLTPEQLPKFKQIESQRQARHQARETLNLSIKPIDNSLMQFSLLHNKHKSNKIGIITIIVAGERD
jgi:hypothetical protein